MVGIFVALHICNQVLPTTTRLWSPNPATTSADTHVAFRGSFSTTSASQTISILGASEYLVLLDGKLIHDGPARFARAYPEYQSITIHAEPGRHILAIHVRNEGVTTRILSQIPPFLWCSIQEGNRPATIDWKCSQIPGYRSKAHRISDILGWIDWSDTNQVWPNWQEPSFDDSKWETPVPVDPGIGEIKPAKTSPVQLNTIDIKASASGTFATTYGYEQDDPAVRFFLDDLNPKGIPSQGVWRRYDLGRVRLGRPKLTLDLPKGAIVETALCEQLSQGRVQPWITLSGSSTCNLDHFVARGGPQEFMPFTPKGGRFLEVHVKSVGPAKFMKEEFLERTYFGEPIGSFNSSDPLLNKIWRTGVETMRACSEDSFVDCPTRERGEWTGDVASVASDIASVAYGDLSLSRRALVQAAQVARADGLVAGVGPGDPGYLSTYAAQWVTACVHYWESTGDKSLLEELLPAARRNIAAFEAQRSDSGVADGLGWGFVDWGYVRNGGPTDMALNIHYYMALKSMHRWELAVGTPKNAVDVANHVSAIAQTISTWIDSEIQKPGGWKNVGYHRASLALLAGLVPTNQKKACIQMIETHLKTCFPNDPNAPRLSDPSVANDRLMTPYFAHFAFAALLEQGETNFVLDQYRKCWGWALGDGRTTWLEVFDTRWSHCHEWSGCPTWQLSRFVLGLQPRYDLGDRTFELNIQPGNLKSASGTIPIPGGGTSQISWSKTNETLLVTISATNPITVIRGGKRFSIPGSNENVRL